MQISKKISITDTLTMWIPEMSECQVSQTDVKRSKNIFMHEIFLMQQQNIWLELVMNRFMMIARLVRFNRDLVSGWVVVTKKVVQQRLGQWLGGCY